VALPSLRAVPEVIREGAASVACSRTLMAVLFAVLHHIRAARLPDAPVRALSTTTTHHHHHYRHLVDLDQLSSALDD
jgi:hypothetical protein